MISHDISRYIVICYPISCDITRYLVPGTTYRDTTDSILSISRNFGTGIEISHPVEIFIDILFPSLIFPQPLLFVTFFGVFVVMFPLCYPFLFLDFILNIEYTKH